MLPRLATSLFVFSLLVSAANHMEGTWKLNAAKSNYAGMPAMKDSTVTYTPDGSGWRYEANGTDQDGHAVKQSFVYVKDGDEIKMSATTLGDVLVLKNGSADVATGTFMRGGKAVGKVKRTISSDGKTMTIVGNSMSADGKKIQYTSVYEKQ